MNHFLAKTLLPAALATASALGCAGTASTESTATTVAQAQPYPARGELLYNTHCIACHTTQIHWRDKKQATDWQGLQAQVRKWQRTAGLAWSDADIADVARYLNSTIYNYPQTGEVISMGMAR